MVNATSVWVALRYIFSGKKSLFINILSWLSVLMVLAISMAFIVILSAFNGLEEVIRKQYNLYNPDFKIIPKQGKVLSLDSTWLSSIKSLPGVFNIVEALEDDAVFKYKDRQMVGKVKGVTDNFLRGNPLEKQIIGGDFTLKSPKGRPLAIIGYGVSKTLTLQLGDVFPLEVWYPNRTKPITLTEEDIKRQSLFVSGVFMLEYEHDLKYILVPLDFVQELMDYKNERSYLEIRIDSNANYRQVEKKLQQVLSANLELFNREQQQSSILRAIKTEKLFAYFTLSAVLLMASLSVFFLITMVILEKKKDIAIYLSLGASKNFIRRVFLWQGMFIIGIGAFLGLSLGTLLCYLQQTYGLITLGSENTLVDAYPIKIIWSDVLVSALIIGIISLMATLIPTRNAPKLEVRANL